MSKTQLETIPSPNGLSQQMEFELALEFTRIVEEAAIESAKTMGMGDRPKSDQVAYAPSLVGALGLPMFRISRPPTPSAT